MGKQVREVPKYMIGDPKKAKISIDMNKIVGDYDILFVCLDTLRYDVAIQQEQLGNTPNLNRYGKWQKRHAPGNYTFPSHMAMFIGNLPSPAEPILLYERERLFVPRENAGLAKMHPYSFLFEGDSIMAGLEKLGYLTICVGGVGFFNKRTEINKILPSFFKESYWYTSFACHLKESFENQIRFIQQRLAKIPSQERVFMYINVDSIHYPNSFYVEQKKTDDLESHAAALRYVDSRINQLFAIFQRRNPTFCIVCSDHGTCYGDDGYQFHCVSHEKVYTVPYMHFLLDK